MFIYLLAGSITYVHQTTNVIINMSINVRQKGIKWSFFDNDPNEQ